MVELKRVLKAFCGEPESTTASHKNAKQEDFATCVFEVDTKTVAQAKLATHLKAKSNLEFSFCCCPLHTFVQRKGALLMSATLFPGICVINNSWDINNLFLTLYLLAKCKCYIKVIYPRKLKFNGNATKNTITISLICFATLSLSTV
jgi:hypothetical protein